jgi:hypothetical protein
LIFQRNGGPDQTALEFRQRTEYVKNEPPLRGRRVERFRQAAKPDASHPKILRELAISGSIAVRLI